MASCNLDIVVNFDGLPGDYVVELNGTTVAAEILEGQTSGSATFSGPFTSGVTLSGYIQPLGAPECRENISVEVPACDFTFNYECKDSLYNITLSGCTFASIDVTAGPGTVDVLAGTIIGADGTTEFDVTTDDNCVTSGLTIADGTNITPCAGDTRTCSYFHDFGNTISVGSSPNIEITSFILDGTEYVTTPVVLGAPNLVAVGGETYNTAFADLINSIGVPNFEAEYPTEAQLLTAQTYGAGVAVRNNIVRLKYPTCSVFTITARSKTPSLDYTWTESAYTTTYGFTYSAVTIGTGAIFDCVAGNEC